MRIGIIGAGNIGGTLGERWAANGHDVMYGVREGSAVPEGGKRGSVLEAAQHGEVVVLTVPWSAAQEAIASCGDLSGKVLVDCTNGGRDRESSGAEKIAGWARGARVVKSFNQTGWEHLKEPSFGAERAVTFVAGDDVEARATVMGLGSELGLDMIDAGPLATAELLEALASLWIQLAFRQGMGRDFAFAVLRR